MTSVTTFNTFADYYMNVDDGTNPNRAVVCFNEALDTSKTTSLKYVDYWTDPQGVIVVHLEHGGIAVVHGVKSVGGTFITPDARILVHVGTNTGAIAGVIDHKAGASTVALTIPNKVERDNTSIQEMKNLAAAFREDAAADDERSVASNTRSHKGGKTDDAGHGDDNVSTTSKKKNKKKVSKPSEPGKTSEPDKIVMFTVFKPATFLQKMIIESGASTPEEMLVFVREEMDEFEYPPDSTE